MGGGWCLTTQMGNRSHTGESVKGTVRELNLATRMTGETLLTNLGGGGHSSGRGLEQWVSLRGRGANQNVSPSARVNSPLQLEPGVSEAEAGTRSLVDPWRLEQWPPQ